MSPAHLLMCNLYKLILIFADRCYWQWCERWLLSSLLLAIVMCWLRWAPAPFLFAFGWFLFLFACFLRGSICISDRWKCISTQRRWVGCCSLPPLVVQFTRASHLLLLLFYSHLQDRAIELNRPTQKKKNALIQPFETITPKR